MGTKLAEFYVKSQYPQSFILWIDKGAFNDYVDTILAFLDLYVDIFDPKRGQSDSDSWTLSTYKSLNSPN